MVDEVNKTIRRTRQYWFIDGLPEIFIGLFFLVLGLIFVGQARVPPRSTAGIVLQFAFPALVIGGVWAGRHLVQGLKERITYPRTGYVSYPKPPRRRRAAIVIAATLAAAVIANLLIRYRPVLVDWTPLLEGIVTGALLVLSGQGLRRFWWLGILSLLCGISLAVLHLQGPDILVSAYFYSLTGLLILVSGTVTLLRYLRTFEAEDNR